ncbi:hypothetical protein ACWEVP_18875 [Amycolatopsis sp. NPDC003865]
MKRDNLRLQPILTGRVRETFTSTERVVLRPDELTLATVSEFVAMLRLVLEKSGLTAGQVAAKTTIARSSAYNLVSATRTGLPVDPVQVRLFVRGCGLRQDQVDAVMRAWARLSVDNRRRRDGSSARSEQSPLPKDLGVDECMEEIRRLRAAGDHVVAAAWARRLTGALLAERAQLDA